MTEAAGPEALQAQLEQFTQELATAGNLALEGRVTAQEDNTFVVTLTGPDARCFAGNGGRTLDALQFLATLATRNNGGVRAHIIFDAENYRERREATLTAHAQQVASEVRESGQEAVLDPLSPLERRIVHRALMDDTTVRTYSEGEEPNRFIIISPAEL